MSLFNRQKANENLRSTKEYVQEIDALRFRNLQLEKRVEILQEELAKCRSSFTRSPSTHVAKKPPSSSHVRNPSESRATTPNLTVNYAPNSDLVSQNEMLKLTVQALNQQILNLSNTAMNTNQYTQEFHRLDDSGYSLNLSSIDFVNSFNNIYPDKMYMFFHRIKSRDHFDYSFVNLQDFEFMKLRSFEKIATVCASSVTAACYNIIHTVSDIIYSLPENLVSKLPVDGIGKYVKLLDIASDSIANFTSYFNVDINNNQAHMLDIVISSCSACFDSGMNLLLSTINLFDINDLPNKNKLIEKLCVKYSLNFDGALFENGGASASEKVCELDEKNFERLTKLVSQFTNNNILPILNKKNSVRYEFLLSKKVHNEILNFDDIDVQIKNFTFETVIYKLLQVIVHRYCISLFSTCFLFQYELCNINKYGLIEYLKMAKTSVNNGFLLSRVKKLKSHMRYYLEKNKNHHEQSELINKSQLKKNTPHTQNNNNIYNINEKITELTVKNELLKFKCDFLIRNFDCDYLFNTTTNNKRTNTNNTTTLYNFFVDKLNKKVSKYRKQIASLQSKEIILSCCNNDLIFHMNKISEENDLLNGECARHVGELANLHSLLNNTKNDYEMKITELSEILISQKNESHHRKNLSGGKKK